MTYDLTPQYDSRASFYGKARVSTNEHGDQILTSYSTDVAVIADGKAKVKGTYSQTTLRHIKEFLKQNGFRAETASQIMKDYGSDDPIESDSDGLGSVLRMTAGVMAIGNILSDDQKEQNDWKARMLKAGLEGRGLIMPDDWDELDEDTKQARLDGAMQILGDKEAANS